MNATNVDGKTPMQLAHPLILENRIFQNFLAGVPGATAAGLGGGYWQGGGSSTSAAPVDESPEEEAAPATAVKQEDEEEGAAKKMKLEE